MAKPLQPRQSLIDGIRHPIDRDTAGAALDPRIRCLGEYLGAAVRRDTRRAQLTLLAQYPARQQQ